MPRSTKYNPEYHDDWGWSLAIKGATDQEISEAFGITRETLWRWRKSFSTLDEALSEGKDIVDSKVERSLYQRAIGFEVTESENIVEMDKDGNPKPVKIRKSTKHIAPDTMAIMYWLNNRKRGLWSQRQEVQLQASNDSETDVMIVLPSNNRQSHIEGTKEIYKED